MDSTERDRLILDHLGLVERVAKKIHVKMFRHYTLEELMAMGNLGLIDAADRYIPEKGNFGTYAKHRIWGEIWDAIRRDDGLAQTARRKGMTYKNVSTECLSRDDLSKIVTSDKTGALDDWQEARLLLSKLKRKDRKVLHDFYLMDRSDREAAKKAKIPLGTMIQRRVYALVKLRKIIKGEWNG